MRLRPGPKGEEGRKPWRRSTPEGLPNATRASLALVVREVDDDRFVAFLRGINVGGHRVTGDDLIEVFVSLGLDAPATFLASGNVIFDASGPAPDEGTIEAALSDRLGYLVPAMLRRASEVRAIASLEPFDPAQLARSSGKPQVLVLKASPSVEHREVLAGLATDEDRLVLADRELHWLPSGGTQESTLDLAFIERTIGPTTMRTHNTIARITAKFLDPPA